MAEQSERLALVPDCLLYYTPGIKTKYLLSSPPFVGPLKSTLRET